MSTRSTVIIRSTDYINENNPNNGIKYMQYYHHWDGYLAGVGMELVGVMLKLLDEDCDKMKSMYDMRNFLEKVLPRPYEEESIDHIHGDLEYIYLISRDDSGVTLSAYKRNWDAPMSDYKAIIEAQSVIPGFLVNIVVKSLGDRNYYWLDKIQYNQED